MSVDHAIETALGHHQAGRLAQAEALYRQVLGQHPRHPDALHLLGMIAHQTGNQDAAIDLIGRAIAINPRSAVYYNNIGGAYRAGGRLDEAAAAYRKAIALQKDFAEAFNNLGIVLKEQGLHAQARDCYRQALKHNPEYVEARWSSVMLEIPAVRDGSEDLDAARDRFAAELARMDRWFTGERGTRGWQAVGTHQPFYLAYQERDNRTLLSAYGALCCRLMQTWQQAQGFKPASGSGAARLRIGIVSAHIHDHSVWNAILKGWYQHLDRDRFELHTFHVGAESDAETQWARTRSHRFDQQLGAAQQWAAALRARDLDVLIYPEIGMDPLTAKLAAMRLAPVQVATWGHPETSGLPSIDYYLSAQDLEPPEAQQYYSEKLVKLAGLGCCYPALPVQAHTPDLARLGIDPSGPLLLCPGTPFKYTPEHDAVFVAIARQLGTCRLVFFRHPVAAFSATVEQRLGRAFRRAGLDFKDYAVFVPWLERPQFYGLMQQADVFLDTIGFSGFNTAMQAVECGLPLVTREGGYLRGRLASGILRRLQLDDLVCDSDEDYIALAVRLARDPAFRQQTRERLAAARPVLFDDVTAVRQLEEFLASTSGGADTND